MKVSNVELFSIFMIDSVKMKNMAMDTSKNINDTTVEYIHNSFLLILPFSENNM
jgi:hypothetical protein